MVEKLQMAQDVVTELKIERVHRMGPQVIGRNRKIVCKFNMFTDRELVRKQKHKLLGSEFYVHEQFPPEIVAKRKRLMPKLKEAKRDGKRAWISYDTLYIDGRPVKDE